MSGNGQSRTLKVAVIAGDGIGPEIMQAALPVIAEAAGMDGIRMQVSELDWGGERLLRTGSAMPADAIEIVRGHDAILLGAVGHPRLTPDVSVWSLVLPLRKGLDLYVNLRPVGAWEHVRSPVSDAAGTDFVVVRENTEGEYAGIGGRVHQGSVGEVATDVAVHSRRAVSRVAHYAFELARSRNQSLTLVTKSNVSRHGYALWDDVTKEIGEREYQDVRLEIVFVDAMAARMIERPQSLGVLLCSNLFGDILSDLGAVLQGGLGMVPSANLSPDTDAPGIFEPVHGSAPDIAGKGIANPLAAILSGAMMLREAGALNAAGALERAAAESARHEDGCTPDIGGTASTDQAAAAVASALKAMALD